MRKISVVSMSRRFELYKQFVHCLEFQISDLIQQYIVFVNDKNIATKYLDLEKENTKIRVVIAAEDFIYKYGHDRVYNHLDSIASTEYILKLFDTDVVEVDKNLFKEELNKNVDLYGIQTYMQRGDVWETKWQLYRKGVIKWTGIVHENQVPNKKGQITKYQLQSMKVFHNNALDKISLELKKTPDGFIILEKTEEGSDSDQRNMLYEYCTHRIVNEGVPHNSVAWFRRHYELNSAVILWYVQRAKEKYKL